MRQCWIPLTAIIEHLRETDATGDPEWVAELIERVKPFRRWQLVEMDPRELYNECSDTKTVEAYRTDMDNLPPIVVVPTTQKPYKYEILDGAHRAAAAEAANRCILVYRPLECVPGAGVS